MIDLDDYKSDRREEVAELDTLLGKLQDCDLQAWDQDFVDDLTKKIDKYGDRAHITPRQWEQIQRMKGQYLDE